MKRHVILLTLAALITIGLSGCYTQLQPIRLNNGFDSYNNGYGGYAPNSSDSSYVSGYRAGYNDANYYFRNYNVYNYWANMGVYSFYNPYDYYYNGYYGPGWNMNWGYNYYSNYYGFNPFYYPWAPYYNSGAYVAYNYYTYPNKSVIKHYGVRASGVYRDANSGGHYNARAVRRSRYSPSRSSSSNNNHSTRSNSSSPRTSNTNNSGNSRPTTRSTYTGHDRAGGGNSSGSRGGSRGGGGSSGSVRSSGRGGGGSSRGSGRGHRNEMQSVWIPSSQIRKVSPSRIAHREKVQVPYRVNTRKIARRNAQLIRRERRSYLRRQERTLFKAMHTVNRSNNFNHSRNRSFFTNSRPNRIRESGISGIGHNRSSSNHSSRGRRH